MRVTVISIMPNLIEAALSDGVVARAVHSGLIDVSVVNPRDFTADIHQTVDDRPYGGGPGMVMKVEPLRRALKSVEENAISPAKKILLAPTGKRFSQCIATDLANEDGIVLVCGRYEGIDQRFIDLYIDEELSIGDYVLSGGELPSLVVIDVISRLIPGTLGNPQSAQQESFSESLLDFPHYTRPAEAEQNVPEVLLSGDHEKISDWRRKESLRRTWDLRPDLLLHHDWTEDDIRSYYELFGN